MITISRSPVENTASDKFIYTTLFLYSDTAENYVDAMSIVDFDLQSLPIQAQDFIQTYYTVENGLRHLIIKSVTNGDYVKALLEITTPYHYVCIDSQSSLIVNSVSLAIEQTNKLFVTAATERTMLLIAGRKHTYAILEGEWLGTQLFEPLVTQKSEKIRTWQ